MKSLRVTRQAPLPKRARAEMQADVVEQLRKRLEFLRYREDSLSKPVDSVKVAALLQRLAKRAGARNSNIITHGLATLFDDFEPEQKATLYRVLSSIKKASLGVDQVD